MNKSFGYRSGRIQVSLVPYVSYHLFAECSGERRAKAAYINFVHDFTLYFNTAINYMLSVGYTQKSHMQT